MKEKYGALDGDRALSTEQLLSPGQRTVSTSSSSARASGPSWEDLKVQEKELEFKKSQLFIDGCYTPLAIERLQEEIADTGGIDLLLTSEWPTEILKGLKDAWPQEAHTRKLAKGAAKQCASVGVAEIAAGAEPKYHAVGLGGVFWRRVPWTHELRGEVVAQTGQLKCGVCRMVALGAVDGSRPGVKDIVDPNKRSYRKPEEPGAEPAKPEKWMHGLELDPDTMPATSEDATVSPWSEAAKAEEIYRMSLKTNAPLERPDFGTMDKEERKRWMQRFGCRPEEMLQLSDKLVKENTPKEKKEKHKSLYKVSEKEKHGLGGNVLPLLSLLLL